MRALIIAIRTIPIEPPAATHRPQTDRFWIPALQVASLGDKCVAHLVVGGRRRMNVTMRAAPYVDLIIHIVEMGSGAERRRQRRRPLIAIDTACGIVQPRLIEQWK